MLLPLAVIGLSVALALAFKKQGSSPSTAVAPVVLPAGTYSSVIVDADVDPSWLATTPQALQKGLAEQGMSPSQVMVTQVSATEPPPAGYTPVPAQVGAPSEQPVGSPVTRVRVRFDALPPGFLNAFLSSVAAAKETGKANAVLRGVYVQEFRVP